MILERLHPSSDGGSSRIETTDAAARDAIRSLYSPPQATWLRLNLIASVDGSAKGADGTSNSLSNPADRAILGAIRSVADVILIGAQTLRDEDYLLPRISRLAVLTASGELSGTRAPSGQRPRVTVIGPASAEARARETLDRADVDFVAIELREGTVPVGSVIDALRDAGFASIVCEGGPSLAVQLLDAGLVDELCLSTSPQVAGTGLPVLGASGGAAIPLTLHQLLRDESGGLYARWLTKSGFSEQDRRA